MEAELFGRGRCFGGVSRSAKLGSSPGGRELSPSLVLQAEHNRRVRAPEGQSVWRNHDFRRVLVGSTVNDIGDWMLTLALPIYVFTTTGSGRNTAVVFLIELIISVVLGPLGGAVADRWDLRLTIVSTNVAQAVALLPLLAATADRVWIVFLVAGRAGRAEADQQPGVVRAAAESCER